MKSSRLVQLSSNVILDANAIESIRVWDNRLYAFMHSGNKIDVLNTYIPRQKDVDKVFTKLMEAEI